MKKGYCPVLATIYEGNFSDVLFPFLKIQN